MTVDDRHVSPSRRLQLLARGRRRISPRTQPPREIPRRLPEVPVPLSFAQQRLWFLDQLLPGSHAYNLPAAFPLPQGIDPDVLQRALTEIVRRHESLRTTFVAKPGANPMQVIAPPCGVGLPIVDPRRLPPLRRNAEVVRLATLEARAPFDLARGPLLRVSLLRTTDVDSVFLLNVHHIVADGWSMGVLFRELGALYEAFATGKPSPLPELPIQYGDFALWQREWLAGGNVLDRQLAYWRERLHDLPALQVPADFSRPPVATLRGGTHVLRVSADVADALQALAVSQNCTLFMVLLAAFDILLARYSGQEDIVVGAPIANRTRAELEPLIGFFVNAQVLRTDLSGDPTFIDLLARVRDVTLGAYANQDVPFERLVEIFAPERDMSRNPLCQISIQLQNAPTATGEPADFDRPAVDVARGTAILDLALSLFTAKRGLYGWIEYSTDLFLERTIERFAKHFDTLLRGIAAGARRRCGEYDLLDDAERRQVVVDWNATAAPFLIEPVHRRIEAQARTTPEAVAVQAEGTSITYGELDRRANSLAHWLRGRGVHADSIVGVAMERSIDLVVAVVAILKAGGAYLPLDLAQPASRLQQILDDARAALVLADEESVPQLAGPVATLSSIDAELAGFSDAAPPCDASPESLAYVIYTSGSTGKPKGVLVPHGAIANHMLWMQRHLPVTELDRVLQRTPVHFDASVWELLTLMFGARLVLPPPMPRVDPARLLDAIRENGITIVQFVPSLLGMLLEEPSFAASMVSVRRCFCGGEPLTPDLVRRVAAVSTAEVYNLYGPTETTIDAAWCRCDPAAERVPIGRPITNVTAYVLDRSMRPLPVGVAGELFIGGAGLARGYLGDPVLTAQRFVPDPFSTSPGARLYRSGDRVRWLAGGTLELLDRIDSQVKLRGHRIELGEVESALAAHPAVRQAVADVRGGMLTAWCAASPGDGDARLEAEHLARRRTFYDERYSDPRHTPDRDGAAALILRLRPRRLLEIGCGAGALLRRVAPSCRQYLAIDISSSALRAARAAINESGEELQHVTLTQRGAHELEVFDTASFDTVVLNGVAADLPSAASLRRVLAEAVRIAGDSGWVVVTDVRDLAAARDGELALHPDFFAALPDVGAAWRFAGDDPQSYDVLLRLGPDWPSLDGAVSLLESSAGVLANDPLRQLRIKHLAAELHRHARERLPAVMVPAAIVVVDAIPLKANGKIDRASLPAPDGAGRRSEHARIAPRSPLEQVLAALWADVLHNGDVGVEDDFFADLGGHSLMATQVVSRVRELFAIDLPVRAMFEHSSVARLAEALVRDGAYAAAVRRAEQFVAELEREEKP